MFIKNVLPKIPQYRLARANLLRPTEPFNLTFSVTNICQSRCKTCNIWEIYKENPKKRSEELNLSEITKIFQSLGHTYIFNVSGGEPFLRPDFVEIIDAACQYLSPAVIHIPTNAIAENLIISKTKEIIHILKTKSPSTKLTIKPSLDRSLLKICSLTFSPQRDCIKPISRTRALNLRSEALAPNGKPAAEVDGIFRTTWAIVNNSKAFLLVAEEKLSAR